VRLCMLPYSVSPPDCTLPDRRGWSMLPPLEFWRGRMPHKPRPTVGVLRRSNVALEPTKSSAGNTCRRFRGAAIFLHV
jgi:hypothetical protein